MHLQHRFALLSLVLLLLLSAGALKAQPTDVTVVAANTTITNGTTTNVTVSWSGGTGPYTIDLYSGDTYANCTSNYTVGGNDESVNASSPVVFTVSPGSTTVFCATVTDNSTASNSSTQAHSVTVSVLNATNQTINQTSNQTSNESSTSSPFNATITTSISNTTGAPSSVGITPTRVVIANGSSANLRVTWGGSVAPYTIDLFSGYTYTNCSANNTVGDGFEQNANGPPAVFTVSPNRTTVYCVTVTDNVSNAGSSNASRSAFVIVNGTLVPPQVSASPTEITPGQTASISATGASGGNPPYRYQWIAGEGFNALTSGAANTLCGLTAQTPTCKFATTASTPQDVYSFVAVLTDASGNKVQSDTSSVAVSSSSTSGGGGGGGSLTIEPSSPTVDAGQSTSILSSNTTSLKPPYTFQWLAAEDGEQLAPDTANTLCGSSAQSAECAFSTSNSTIADTYTFQLEAINETGAIAQSNSATVVVNSPLGRPSVSSSPSSLGEGEVIDIVASAVEGTGSGHISYSLLAAPNAGGPFTQVNATCALSQDNLSVSCSYVPHTGTYYYEVAASDQASPSVTTASAPTQAVSVSVQSGNYLAVAVLALVVIGGLIYFLVIKGGMLRAKPKG